MKRNDAEYMQEVIRLLKIRYKKEMRTSLNHTNPWQLLVATILSAQSQDSQVNKITPTLFKRFQTVGAFSRIAPNQLYPYIKSLGLYRNKGKNIIASAKIIVSDFGSKVPRTSEELITLPGVGRKTANVVLSNAFGINSGIAIDTHCIAVSNRLHLARTRNPEIIERKLMAILPQKEWANVTHLFIALGRDTCQARVTYCGRCILKDICPSATF